MKEQKPLGPAQNKNNERNIKICKRNKIKANYKLAREQKPFGPAQKENKLKYMQTTNEYATRNKILFGPALLKEKETKAKYVLQIQIRKAPGGGTWVNFCWVCATGLSRPLPHYSLFCNQL